MKQFGKDFLTSLIPGLFVAVLLIFAIQTAEQRNADVIQQTKTAIAEEQAKVDAYNQAIDASVHATQVLRDQWDSLHKNDPTETMSDQQIHDATWAGTMPTVSPNLAAQENELEFKLAGQQAACEDLIEQFNKLTLPSFIKSPIRRTDECQGK